jgi:predicted RND superfamily exporter protein
MRIAEYITARPLSVYIATLLLFALAASTATRLRFDDDTDRLFAQDGGGQEHSPEEQLVSVDNVLTVVLRTHEPLSDRDIHAIDHMTLSLRALPDVVAVQSLTSPIVFANSDSIRLGPVFGPASIVSGDVEERAAVLWRYHPFGGRLLSRDIRHTAIMIRLAPELRTNEQIRPTADNVRDVVGEALSLSDSPAVAYYTGIPFYSIANIEVMLHDLIWLTPAAASVVFLVVLITFRNLKTTLVLMIPILVSNALLLGTMGALGHELNPLTAVLPPLLIVMASADGMHIVNHYNRSEGATAAVRASMALRRSTRACTLTSVTTMIGFGSLGLAGLPALRDFGLLAALGMGYALVMVLILVPAGIVLLRVTVLSLSPGQTLRRAGTIWGNYMVGGSRPRIVVMLSCLALSATLPTLSKIQIDQFLGKALPSEHSASVGIKLLEDHLGGVLPLEISLSGAQGSFLHPNILERMAALEASARHIERASVSISLASVLSRAGAAPYTVDSDSFVSLPGIDFDAELRMLVTHDFSRARIVVLTPDHGAAHFNRTMPDIENLGRTIFEGTGVVVEVTGEVEATARGLITLGQELVYGLVFSMCIVFTIIALAFRSLLIGILIILPNAIPLVMTSSLLLLSGNDMDPISAISFTVILGVSVDNTIHILCHFETERLTTTHVPTAVSRAVSTSFEPVVTTAVSLSAGFALLFFSDFQPLRTFGVLVCTGQMLALVADLTLTPSLLCLLGSSRACRMDTAPRVLRRLWS